MDILHKDPLSFLDPHIWHPLSVGVSLAHHPQLWSQPPPPFEPLIFSRTHYTEHRAHLPVESTILTSDSSFQLASLLLTIYRRDLNPCPFWCWPLLDTLVHHHLSKSESSSPVPCIIFFPFYWNLKNLLNSQKTHGQSRSGDGEKISPVPPGLVAIPILL